jgi:predicted DNA-binding transcriptional regulator AlpA
MSEQIELPFEERLMTIREVAALLGVSRCQVWRLRKASDFPRPLHLTPTIKRWRRTDLMTWVQTKR